MGVKPTLRFDAHTVRPVREMAFFALCSAVSGSAGVLGTSACLYQILAFGRALAQNIDNASVGINGHALDGIEVGGRDILVGKVQRYAVI